MNCLLIRVTARKRKERIQVTKYEEEDVSSYWMALRK